ncbi:MAG TPA: chromosome segregation protein SMC [Firmicutes bacterium]|nr:chromosome segregation protein SMC [Bacillota bacterium]
MLKSVTVHGFKSFCDRTELVFGKGITAIVGPNGCGKSNLADALRWVLGEHNARLLRCNKLEEIVFSGTNRRKAMGMAEVRLLLEGVLDEGEHEIMRRFTRDGTGEYRINDKVCRWKDIYESLLGTGLSHTGYVVIGQGTIQELAGGKPEDRRIWIEEASGVSRYRVREREVETRLRGAKEDIVRLSDLLVELEERKKALRSDWETAREYHRLVSQKNDIELAMWLYQEQEESRRVQNVARRIGRYTKELEECIAAAHALSKEIEPTKSRLEAVENLLKSKISEREQVASELVALEKNRDSARGKLALVAREIETRRIRRNVLQQEIAVLSGREAQLQEQRASVSGKLEITCDELSRVENERQAFETQWRVLSEKVIKIRESMASSTARLNQLQQDKDRLRAQFEDKRRETVEINVRLVSLNEQVAQLERELEETRQGISESAEKQSSSQAACRALEEQVHEIRIRLGEEVSAQKRLEAQRTRLATRKRLLEEMERSFEGYGKGPRTILTARQQSVLDGIIGSVAELFSCDAKYVPALSAAVGGAAENIVVTDEEAAKAAIDFLKQHKSGRCTLLPLNLLRPGKLHPRAVQALSRVQGVRPLISVVRYTDDLRPCAEYLFGRVVLADTMDHALAFMKESGWVTRVVTLGGENIQPGGAITGGEAPRHESIFLRKQELASLAQAIGKVTGELNAVSSRIVSLETNLSALTSELEQSREDALLAGTAVARLKEQASQLEQSLERARAEVVGNKQKIEHMTAAEQELLAQIQEVASCEKQISDILVQKEAELKGFETQIRDRLGLEEQYSERIAGLSREKQELEQRLASLLRQLENLRGEAASTRKNLDEEGKELARLEVLREELASQETSLGESISALEERMGELSARISELSTQAESLRQYLEQALAKVESLSLEQTSLRSRIADGRLEHESLDAALSDTRKLIAARYGITDPGSCEHPRIERQEALNQVERIEMSIKSLGTVNLKAEQDFKDLSERIDNIRNEIHDVEDAIAELNRARELIRREIQKRFVETFETVDENFQVVFRELFGGGRGKLSLVEDTMGVEVLAEPPGRRHKQFSLLSGGERSLCGIALIFAILAANPSPVIVLDEVDSSLDEANVVRFAQFLKKYSEHTQFIVITHQESTMEAADIIYGITMEEPGVSKVFSMRLENR